MSIIPGIEAREPERTLTRSGFDGSPNVIPTLFSTRLRHSSTSRSVSGGSLPRFEERRAFLGGDREPGGHGEPQARHLGEPRPFAAEEIAPLGVAFCLTVPEKEHVGCHGGGL